MSNDRAFGRWLRRLPANLVIVAVAAFAAFPLFWLVSSSLKTPQEITKLPPVWLPSNPSLDAFGEAFRLLPIGSAFLNSFLIAGLSTAAVVATPAGTPASRPSTAIPAMVQNFSGRYFPMLEMTQTRAAGHHAIRAPQPATIRRHDSTRIA